MNRARMLFVAGLAMLCIAGCSDSVNTEKHKKIVDPFDEFVEIGFSLLKRQAEAGDALAQNELGMRYYEGKGVPKDAAQAVVWWRKAAEQGNATAQRRLGVSYLYGEGMPKDPTRNPFLLSEEGAKLGVEWLHKSAEQGDAEAQYILGQHFYDEGWETPMPGGKTIPANDLDRASEAVKWYAKAAEQGHAGAQYNLGWHYSHGAGVAKDVAQAVAWYRKAAEQGHAGAQYKLGEMYFTGEGVPKDATLAVSWFRKAAEQGNADGKFRLGLEYAFGTGVPNDLIRAYMWANLAAAQGGEEARIASRIRDDISGRMSHEQIAEAQRLTREWKPGQHTESATSPRGTSNGALEKALVGTAFIVSKQGHLLTNRHVVRDCQQVRLTGSDKPLKVLPQDEVNDLALLQMAGKPKDVAVFRATNDLRQGESIAAYGYPLQGALAAGGNLSPGVVSALAGLGNNTSHIQITAPVQTGNSGGPVLDSKGQVVGVVVQKLNAVKVAKLTGDVPQNVNFAINESTTRAFLDSNQVEYKTGSWWNVWQKDLADIAEDARAYTVVVECWK